MCTLECAHLIIDNLTGENKSHNDFVISSVHFGVVILHVIVMKLKEEVCY